MFQNVLKSALDAAKVREWEKFIKRPKGDYFDQSNQGHVIKYVVKLNETNILVIRRKKIVKFSLLVTKLTIKLCLPLPQ